MKRVRLASLALFLAPFFGCDSGAAVAKSSGHSSTGTSGGSMSSSGSSRSSSTSTGGGTTSASSSGSCPGAGGASGTGGGGAGGACAAICAAEGGTCTNGRCLVTLATDGGAMRLAIDAANVYWTTADLADGGNALDGYLKKCSKAGCGQSPTVLDTEPKYAGAPLSGLVRSGSSLFWATADSMSASFYVPGWLKRCTVAGCPGGAVTFGGNANTVAADGVDVYWTNGPYLGNPQQKFPILACPEVGCPPAGPTTLFSSGQVLGLLGVGAGLVVVAAGDGPTTIATCPVSGCSTLTPIAKAASLWGAYVDDTWVYWADAGGNMPGTGSIQRCLLDGSCCKTIAAKLDSPGGLATDGVNVCFSSGQVIARCPVAGCPGGPTQLAQGNAYSIAVDATSVYWVNADGTGVMKLTPK